MRELPEEVTDELRRFVEDEYGVHSIEALQRNLATIGWRLVPETVIPRAWVLTEAAALVRSAAGITGARLLTAGVSLNDTATQLAQLRNLAAALLGVDLSDLAEHVEGGEPG